MLGLSGMMFSAGWWGLAGAEETCDKRSAPCSAQVRLQIDRSAQTVQGERPLNANGRKHLVKMPSEMDVAPKAISGRDWMVLVY